MLSSKGMFLEANKDKSITAKPNTVVSLILSPNEESKKEGEEQIALLIAALVKKYKTFMFPLIRDSIDKVKKNVEYKIEKQSKYNVNINEIFLSSEVLLSLDEEVFEQDKLPVFIPRAVILGHEIIAWSSKTIGGDGINRLNGNDTNQVISIINDICAKRTNMDKIMQGMYGKNALSNLFLVINNIDANMPPKDTVGKIDDYRDTIFSLRNLVNYYCFKTKFVLSNAVISEKLVYSKGDDYITVYGSTIGDFYSKGGTIEVLYGLFINGNTSATVSSALNDSEIHKRSYTREYNKFIITKKSSTREVYESEYIFLVSEMVRSNELSKHKVDVIVEAFKDYSDVELADIKSRVEEIVADYLFKESGIRRFIDSFKYFESQNIDTKDIAGMASIDLILDYITGNLIIQ